MSKLFRKSKGVLKGVMVVFLSLILFSCDSDDADQPIEQSVEQSVEVSVESTTLNIGEKVTVTPTFTPNIKPTKTYKWTISNTEVVEITVNEDYSAVISAIKKGTANITFSSSDGKLTTSFDITVEGDVDDGVLKVLAIGNSFSADAVENYLYELASAENVAIVIGNVYKGGTSLGHHWENAQNNTAAYDYRKIGEDGSKTNTPNTTIETAIKDENWDYISFQQVSGNSGQYETFVTPLPALIKYVKDRSTNADAQYILHQTWAYSQNSTHANFPNYESDQVVMYEAIVDAVRKAKVDFGLDLVIPAGTAIQNGRNTFIGDNFNRDGYHLSYGIGRYTAACTWFEALTSISVVGNSFKPDGFSELETEAAQHSAHAAVLNPDKVTLLADYEQINPQSLEADVLINFGLKFAPKWNTLESRMEGGSITNLKDIDDNFTNVSIAVTERFSAVNLNGESATTTDFNMPADISSDSFYGNSQGVWRELEIRQGQVTLSGLVQDTTYNLCFFGSRAKVSDNRETKYIVVGKTTETVNLQTANNTAEIVCANNIKPDENGKITITVTAGDTNDNSYGFFYLNAMRLSPGE
ncbi:hypothetical protein KCTC52924_00709 [Arenibacter antarcticus]|uniref:DUF4886 domain-containing protein n=1 Tax=Arenibacter antarcticus TaxID=2040469 RepID=A0ABW5VG50_9FLAO|nr:DUF4886 domain-containing protein [Arenibacter sp. H213]MCM4169230.1 hypothetical protein [Arenibacter sp. H213]